MSNALAATNFLDWSCESCNEWASDRGDSCHTGHDLIMTDRTKELVRVAAKWRKARDLQKELAPQLYELINIAHGNGMPETKIAELAGVDRMTVRRALGKR
jgi:hypothetical protein